MSEADFRAVLALAILPFAIGACFALVVWVEDKVRSWRR